MADTVDEEGHRVKRFKVSQEACRNDITNARE